MGADRVLVATAEQPTPELLSARPIAVVAPGVPVVALAATATLGLPLPVAEMTVALTAVAVTILPPIRRRWWLGALLAGAGPGGRALAGLTVRCVHSAVGVANVTSNNRYCRDSRRYSTSSIAFPAAVVASPP
ncbi:hypothetical protein GCM10010123_32740 [Pilimelia anulata]|uniref:Uncharacterized protein n=1 Tax=Pilimelia anulata TaxID=53371 RepID=A0A8J3FB44_9ACTN|nr:hypothetical protein [Pilimelia anulata]GGK00281.1 hypothetical protein GCM10010123_32740 [Pilimelia anulata]